MKITQGWMTEADHKAFWRILEIWAEYMGVPPGKLGWSDRVIILEGYGFPDTEQKQSKHDFDIGDAANACINDLEPHQSAAIRRIAGIMTQKGYAHVASVMRFPRLTFAESLIQAERALLDKFRANRVTANVWEY